MNIKMKKKMKRYQYITAAACCSHWWLQPDRRGDHKESVTLYNPYKPTLKEANKRTLLPQENDTTVINIRFDYDFTPGSFMPAYEVSPIKSAVLSPNRWRC